MGSRCGWKEAGTVRLWFCGMLFLGDFDRAKGDPQSHMGFVDFEVQKKDTLVGDAKRDSRPRLPVAQKTTCWVDGGAPLRRAALIQQLPSVILWGGWGLGINMMTPVAEMLGADYGFRVGLG